MGSIGRLVYRSRCMFVELPSECGCRVNMEVWTLLTEDETATARLRGIVVQAAPLQVLQWRPKWRPPTDVFSRGSRQHVLIQAHARYHFASVRYPHLNLSRFTMVSTRMRRRAGMCCKQCVLWDSVQISCT